MMANQMMVNQKIGNKVYRHLLILKIINKVYLKQKQLMKQIIQFVQIFMKCHENEMKLQRRRRM